MTTLAAAVERWRGKLEDANSSNYLWSNQELTDYFNYICTDVCHDIPLIYDTTTASICTVSLTALLGSTYSVSDRIVKITRAKISTQTSPLSVVTVGYMDANYSDWENATADEPQLLIDEGVGTNKIRIYPAPDASYTLSLGVYRNQLVDLVYATHSASEIELQSQYLQMLDNGIYWQAYGKQDVDTNDPAKEDKCKTMYLEDKERLKRMVLFKTSKTSILSPMKGLT